MDELELLKRDWKKKDKELPRLSFDEIYRMIWKRSSSIVKWIFIISVIEFLLPFLLYLFPSMAKSLAIWRDLGLGDFLIALNVIQYGVVCFFIIQFYKRYREISTLDNAKQLLANILKTRKTVKYYVIFCLSLIFVSFLVMTIGIYLSDDPLSALGYGEKMQRIAPENIKTTMILAVLAIGILTTLVMGLIYFLLYGLLLKKLNKNYRELKEMDL